MIDDTEQTQIRKQAHLLTEELKNPDFRSKYLGSAIVYYDHKVLAVAKSEVEALRLISDEDKRRIPFVVRLITEGNGEFMGGPKSEGPAQIGETYRVTFTRVPNGQFHSQGLEIAGQHYLIAEEGKLRKEARSYAFNALEQAVVGKEKGKLEITTS